MFHKYRTALAKAHYNWLCRDVLKTPPLQIKPAPLAFLSMVCSADLIMYLVAIKSVYLRIGEGTIVVIDDGSLTASDRRIIADHLGEPRFIRLQDIATAPCPSGGCWERLLTVVDLSREAYVIQVDSDILAINDLPEVVQAYRENRAFTLATRMGQRTESLREAASRVATHPGSHVQIAAERVFDRLPDPDGQRYVRGCAGFAGFARGGIDRAQIEAFSTELTKVLGAKWREWGSEQVASNFAIANSPDPVILPFPQYASYDPEVDVRSSRLLHFLGSFRFHGGVYARESRAFIEKITERGKVAA